MRKTGLKETRISNAYSTRPIDIIDHPREYYIRIYMPEFDESNVTMKVSGDMLEVTAWNDFTLGMKKRTNYQRSFKLPGNSDTSLITAHLRNDVLNIRIPKTTFIRQFNPSRRAIRTG